MPASRHPLPTKLSPDGFAVLPDGSRLGPLDAIIYCTGFRYTFPFLLGEAGESGAAGPEAGPAPTTMPGPRPEQPQQPQLASHRTSSSMVGGLGVRDQRVGPLYRHVFPPSLAPGLSLLGLPWKVVPFPQHELQAKLVARLLSGRAQLPSREEMEQDVESSYLEMEVEGVPSRYGQLSREICLETGSLVFKTAGGKVAAIVRVR